jgi:hypothetical protein
MATNTNKNKNKPHIVDKTKKGNTRIYLTNKELLAEVISSKEKGVMSNNLAQMLTLLCDRYSRKGNFASYTYIDDMRAFAMLMLCKTWASFNPEKSNNPFAYFSQCIKNSFIQFLNQEKKQRNIRDSLLVEEGLNPSHTYQLDMAKKEKEEKLKEKGIEYDPHADDSFDDKVYMDHHGGESGGDSYDGYDAGASSSY